VLSCMAASFNSETAFVATFVAADWLVG